MTNKEKRAKRAEDFKNQKIQSAKDFNFDQHNKKGVEGTHVSGQEVNYLRQNHKKNGGTGNFRDTYAALQAQKDAGATFGKRAQAKFDRMGARIDKLDARKAAKEKAKNAQSETTEPAQNTTPAPTTTTEDTGNPTNTAVVDANVDNSQEQNVNQDNDINNNVSGNNNYIVNNQDNSVRQYGGSNRTFIYNSAGGSSATDTPASMATLAGHYDVDDSPSAVASNLDMMQDLNAQAQKKYKDTSHIAQGAIHRAGQNSFIDTAGLDARVRGREQNSYDRAALMSKSLWGDLSNMNFNWTPNKPEDKVEQPNFGKMKDDYTDF